VPGSDEPVPVVSGNVSFYNESHSGSAVPPSPIVACYGLLEDYSLAVSLCLKRPGSEIVLVGERMPGLAGSALMGWLGRQGEGGLPDLDLDMERRAMHAVLESIGLGLVLACHDISDGGLAAALAEMVIGGWGRGAVGAEVSLDQAGGLSTAELLFSESGGFVLEVPEGRAEEVLEAARKCGAPARAIGRTTREHRLVVMREGARVLDIGGCDLRRVWQDALEGAIR
jgi:phosphoribosylformylglycinamidine synthase